MTSQIPDDDDTFKYKYFDFLEHHDLVLTASVWSKWVGIWDVLLCVYTLHIVFVTWIKYYCLLLSKEAKAG